MPPDLFPCPLSGPSSPNYLVGAPPATPPPGSPQPVSPFLSPPGLPPFLPVPHIDAEIIARVELLTRENERLYHQLQRKEQRSQALATVYKSLDNSLFVLDASCRPITILSCEPKAVYHIIPAPPSKCIEYYAIWLKGVDAPIELAAQDYNSDKRLLAVLQEVPGVTVPAVKLSRGVLMRLLRGVFGQMMSKIHLDYYAGWQVTDGDTAQFWTFDGGYTHLEPKLVEEPRLLATQRSDAQAGVVAERFYRAFEAVREPLVRAMMFLWHHIADLYTLLELLGFPVPLSLCFYALERDVQSFSKRLFTWRDDGPISLDMPPADFVQELLSRKDQALLVTDHGRLQNAVQNARVLDQAIVTHQVTWTFNRETRTLPLRAPVTICTDRASALSCAPEVINLDLELQDFDRKALKDLLGQLPDSQEYREVFIGFAERRCADLRAMLNKGLRYARKLAFDEMNEACVLILGIFIGVADFLEEFFKFCNLATPPVDFSDDVLIDPLRSLLCQTSGKSSLRSISDMFAAVSRENIRKGFLTPTPKSKGGTPLPTTVFYDNDFVYFPSPAFRSVCQAIDQNQTTILRALIDEGALGGKPINGTTPQTRIPVKGLYRLLPVYAVDRTIIEPFGDQLFEEAI